VVGALATFALGAAVTQTIAGGFPRHGWPAAGPLTRATVPPFRPRRLEVEAETGRVVSIAFLGIQRGARVRLLCRAHCDGGPALVTAQRVRRSGLTKVRIPSRRHVRIGSLVEVRVTARGKIGRYRLFRLTYDGAKARRSGCLGSTDQRVSCRSPRPQPPALDRSPLLWATVNVCDTASNPDTIGIRASMPGSGVASEQMYMRIQVEYLSRSDNQWHPLPQGADSDWIAVGRATSSVREAGWDFRFAPPADGSGYLLRGSVAFEWRAGGTVVHRAHELTTEGHVSTAGADPPGYSAAVCEIK
jgi:hypothetical protein